MAINISGNGDITGINSLNTAVSATELGYLDGISGIGKVLQVVRSSSSTNQNTTSNVFVDIPEMSITITPQSATSTLMIIAIISLRAERTSSGTCGAQIQITDSLNNPISGTEDNIWQVRDVIQAWGTQTFISHSSSLSTSARTYKLRYRTSTSGITVYAMNGSSTGQMYAIEVAA